MKFLSNCFHPDFLYHLPLFKLFLLLFSRYQNIIIVIALLWGIPMKSFKRNGHRLFLSLLLSVLLLLQACSSGQTPANNIASQTPESKQFTELTDTIFKENVSSDALSLNYTLSNPEKYGINPAVGGFEPISYEKMANAAPENENLLNSLENINKSSLSIPQQILYDNLTYTLQMNLKEQEFILFSRAISPVTGLQAQALSQHESKAQRRGRFVNREAGEKRKLRRRNQSRRYCQFCGRPPLCQLYGRKSNGRLKKGGPRKMHARSERRETPLPPYRRRLHERGRKQQRIRLGRRQPGKQGVRQARTSPESPISRFYILGVEV